ncbi:hypothetical protein Sjap_021696 [Stephania japonica]|uniref:Uncharacterized protein n=1 Tax=Stephania japonica TaxID=461633 RepID=A0AAP0EMV5_9MAGN
MRGWNVSAPLRLHWGLTRVLRGTRQRFHPRQYDIGNTTKAPNGTKPAGPTLMGPKSGVIGVRYDRATDLSFTGDGASLHRVSDDVSDDVASAIRLAGGERGSRDDLKNWEVIEPAPSNHVPSAQISRSGMEEEKEQRSLKAPQFYLASFERWSTLMKGGTFTLFRSITMNFDIRSLKIFEEMLEKLNPSPTLINHSPTQSSKFGWSVDTPNLLLPCQLMPSAFDWTTKIQEPPLETTRSPKFRKWQLIHSFNSEVIGSANIEVHVDMFCDAINLEKQLITCEETERKIDLFLLDKLGRGGSKVKNLVNNVGKGIGNFFKKAWNGLASEAESFERFLHFCMLCIDVRSTRYKIIAPIMMHVILIL